MKQVIVAGLLGLILLSACEHKMPAVAVAGKFVLPDTMKNMIQMDTVRNSNITDELTLSGVISFNDNNVIKIFPQVSGKVMECKVTLGDKVTKGQVLAVIHSADVAGSYNDLSSANADLAISKRQMDNAESLYKNGISSEKEYNEAKQNYEKALSSRNKVQSVININGGGKANEGGQYMVVSPINGYIVEKKVNAGAFIRPDMGDNLFTISDLKNVWVYANVYEADISKIKEGYSVKVLPLSYPGKTFIGKIDKISQVLDPQSKAMKVRVNIDNSEMLLKPDMFAKVLVNNTEGVTALCIPTASLIPQEGKNYVVVYRNDSDLKVTQVELIKTVNEKTFISSGLNVGELLITKNQILLYSKLTEQ